MISKEELRKAADNIKGCCVLATDYDPFNDLKKIAITSHNMAIAEVREASYQRLNKIANHILGGLMIDPDTGDKVVSVIKLTV